MGMVKMDEAISLRMPRDAHITTEGVTARSAERMLSMGRLPGAERRHAEFQAAVSAMSATPQVRASAA